MDINKQFHTLMSSMNYEALKAARKDDNDAVKLIEDAMSELLDSWTDYMMSSPQAMPTDNYMYWFDKIQSWH